MKEEWEEEEKKKEINHVCEPIVRAGIDVTQYNPQRYLWDGRADIHPVSMAVCVLVR